MVTLQVFSVSTAAQRLGCFLWVGTYLITLCRLRWFAATHTATDRENTHTSGHKWSFCTESGRQPGLFFFLALARMSGIHFQPHFGAGWGKTSGGCLLPGG